MSPGGLLERLARAYIRGCCGLDVSWQSAPPDGPFMVCANHRSHADSIVILTALDLPFAACGLVAADDYFFRSQAKLALISKVLTLIPLSRQPTPAGFRVTVDSCRAFLAGGGRVLVAYPEGTRNTRPEMAAFKRGPAALAARLGMPILPAYIRGTADILPKGRLLPRAAPAEIRFGAAIDPRATSAGGVKAVSLAVNSLLQESIEKLSMAPPRPTGPSNPR